MIFSYIYIIWRTCCNLEEAWKEYLLLCVTVRVIMRISVINFSVYALIEIHEKILHNILRIICDFTWEKPPISAFLSRFSHTMWYFSRNSVRQGHHLQVHTISRIKSPFWVTRISLLSKLKIFYRRSEHTEIFHSP